MGEQDGLDAIWEEHRELTAARLAVIARAARAAADGALDLRLRTEAAAEAHTVAGAAGIFGRTEGARLGKEIERLLKSDAPLSTADGARLVALAEALIDALAAPSDRRDA